MLEDLALSISVTGIYTRVSPWRTNAGYYISNVCLR